MDYNYKIIQHIGKLTEEKKEWVKELNLISWNGWEPKYDIRPWTDDHEKMGRGITLSKEEMSRLVDLMQQLQS